MNNIKNIIIGVLAVFVLILGIFSFKFYKDYIKLREEYASTLIEKGDFILDGNLIDKESYIESDGKIFLSVALIKDKINRDVHLSNSGARLYVPINSTINENFKLETNYINAYVFDKAIDINVPVVDMESKKYVELDLVKDILGFSYSRDHGDYHLLWTKDTEMLSCQAINGSSLYSNTNLNFALEGTNKNDKFIILNSEITDDDRYTVISKSGTIGNVEKKDFVAIKEFTYEKVALNKVRENKTLGKVNLTWEQISSYKNRPDLDTIKKIEGVNVLSPTWFSLNVEGIVINEADKDYVNKAHQEGYQVWALFSNSFRPEWTRDMLSSPVNRERTIGQMLLYTSMYNLDGINIDFENMYIEDKDLFTSFVAELSSKLKEQNMIVSIDVTVPWGSDRYSKVLDRVALVKHVDYMMLMAYDEHWGSSPESGPVASIPWTIKGIEESLALIPKEKLVLSMPLYTRIWQENVVNGKTQVSSSTLSTKGLEAFVKEKNASHSFDSENGLNYYSYQENGYTYRIWAEDKMSIEKRISLYKSYDLAGIATWSKKFADEKIWQIISDVF